MALKKKIVGLVFAGALLFGISNMAFATWHSSDKLNYGNTPNWRPWAWDTFYQWTDFTCYVNNHTAEAIMVDVDGTVDRVYGRAKAGKKAHAETSYHNADEWNSDYWHSYKY